VFEKLGIIDGNTVIYVHLSKAFEDNIESTHQLEMLWDVLRM
jgi:hypothetical protein